MPPSSKMQSVYIPPLCSLYFNSMPLTQVLNFKGNLQLAVRHPGPLSRRAQAPPVMYLGNPSSWHFDSEPGSRLWLRSAWCRTETRPHAEATPSANYTLLCKVVISCLTLVVSACRASQPSIILCSTFWDEVWRFRRQPCDSPSQQKVASKLSAERFVTSAPFSEPTVDSGAGSL